MMNGEWTVDVKRWLEARKAMLAGATPGPWKHRLSKGDTPADDMHDVVQVERGAHFSIALLRSWEHRTENADLIVAAVNDQRNVVRLVEAAIAFTSSYRGSRDEELCRDDLEDALAALVSGEESE